MAIFETVYRFFGWWIINIDLLLLLTLAVGGLLLFFRKVKWGKRLVVISCVSFGFFGVVPFSLWMVENLENRFPKIDQIPLDAKGMILLGGSFDKRTSLDRKTVAYNLTAGRLIEFVELAKAHPQFQLAFTGNQFEVETAKKVFKNLGIDPSLVLFEGGSKDTKENAARSAQLLNPSHTEKWLLITSAYHMPRSIGLFRKAGFNVIPYPVDYHTPGNYEPLFCLGLNLSLDAWAACSREWLGMIINYLLGRSSELYPGPQAS
ncbi:MAG: YdcF family protein [Proteobacteria bacterium]|nr:YdcF family protein [Pseudomonadota bacterium]